LNELYERQDAQTIAHENQMMGETLTEQQMREALFGGTARWT
jgi:hypothetical protein